MLTRCYCHWGTRLYVCPYSPALCSHLKRFGHFFVLPHWVDALVDNNININIRFRCVHIFLQKPPPETRVPSVPSDPEICLSCLKKNLNASRPSEFVVGDSHLQRIVLATEETRVTQQVSHRLIKCQSLFSLWSRKGTKVNGSRHGDNPLLRPTGIQTAKKSYTVLQAMAPTNVKTVHQTSLLHNIESNLDRLELLSPTHDQRS